MLAGLVFTSGYIIYFKFISPHLNNEEYWFLSISPEGIGFIGMLINLSVAVIVSFLTKAPPENVIRMIEKIRSPE